MLWPPRVQVASKGIRWAVPPCSTLAIELQSGYLQGMHLQLTPHAPFGVQRVDWGFKGAGHSYHTYLASSCSLPTCGRLSEQMRGTAAWHAVWHPHGMSSPQGPLLGWSCPACCKRQSPGPPALQGRRKPAPSSAKLSPPAPGPGNPAAGASGSLHHPLRAQQMLGPGGLLLLLLLLLPDRHLTATSGWRLVEVSTG